MERSDRVRLLLCELPGEASSILLGVCEVAFVTYCVLHFSYFFWPFDFSTLLPVADWFAVVITFGILLYGVKRKDPKRLTPFIVLQYIDFVVYLLCMFCGIYWAMERQQIDAVFGGNVIVFSGVRVFLAVVAERVVSGYKDYLVDYSILNDSFDAYQAINS